MPTRETTASLALASFLHEAEIPYEANPRWDEARKCHDWRNHVPDELKRLWWLMHPDARMAIMLLSIPLAQAEVWE